MCVCVCVSEVKHLRLLEAQNPGCLSDNDDDDDKDEQQREAGGEVAGLLCYPS